MTFNKIGLGLGFGSVRRIGRDRVRNRRLRSVEEVVVVVEVVVAEPGHRRLSVSWKRRGSSRTRSSSLTGAGTEEHDKWTPEGETHERAPQHGHGGHDNAAPEEALARACSNTTKGGQLGQKLRRSSRGHFTGHLASAGCGGATERSNRRNGRRSRWRRRSRGRGEARRRRRRGGGDGDARGSRGAHGR